MAVLRFCLFSLYVYLFILNLGVGGFFCGVLFFFMRVLLWVVCLFFCFLLFGGGLGFLLFFSFLFLNVEVVFV